ncbi:MAG: type IV secretory system conjugative DNA transfer family protein, partial [Actinobacteria bacterium]|nr:type IV secretory system conjugative DNA transfer family protein [Actinomycetota bacterium]
RVWVYDPTGSAGPRPEGWSALAACGTWAGAQRVAAWLVEAARPRRDSVTDADYWYGQARRALAPYLHAAALAGEPMATVVRWVESVEEAEVDHVLCELAPDAPREAVGSWALAAPGDGGEALVAARSLWQKEERLRDSILATAENVLAGYADPGVAALDEAGGIDLDEWLEGDNTIYVVAAAHDQARLRPVFSVLVAEAVRRAYDLANACGGRLVDPCLVLLDEAGNIAPAAQLPTWAATARSHGISLITVWQDLAQLRALYGDSAATVLNNHRARLFGSGIADVSTLEYLSRIVGQSAFVEHNRSVDLAGGRRSLSEHTSWRPVAPVDTLRRLRRDEALLVHGADLPVRLRLRPWFAERSLRGTAEGPGS